MAIGAMLLTMERWTVAPPLCYSYDSIRAPNRLPETMIFRYVQVNIRSSSRKSLFKIEFANYSKTVGCKDKKMCYNRRNYSTRGEIRR